MNCAFFVDNFKGMSGRTYLINGDINALNWLSDKLKLILSLAVSSSIKVGDGNPFESNVGIVYIVIDSDIDKPDFKWSENQFYLLSISRDDITELLAKLDGMIEFGKASHNYFDIGSGDVSRVFITTGEYADALLAKMAQDEDRVR
jgi:hypothetical protein